MKIRTAILLALATTAFPLAAQAQVESGYVLDYSLNMATNAGGNINYATDNSSLITPGSFDRVAYQLTLAGSGNGNDTNGTIWVSFDTINANANKLGVPNFASGEFYQQNVSNMNVFSNVAGVVTGTGIGTGNIEFWPYDYSQGNGAGVPNASGSSFDWGDTSTLNNGYGSMQIANHGVTSNSGQMLLSYNAWGTDNGTGDVGIGTRSTDQPDWTFAGNLGDFTTTANLQVWVHPVPEPATLVLFGLGAIGLLAVARRRRSA